MKKISILFVLIIFLFPTNIIAREMTKQEATYEIINVKIVKDYLVIEGWGFLTGTQHYTSKYDHDYEFIFISDKGDTFKITSELIKKSKRSQTDNMHYAGLRLCGIKEFNKKKQVCNYKYDNVGFEVRVPLSHMKTNHSYTIKMKIFSRKSKNSGVITLYYPMLNDLYLSKNNRIFRLSSKIDTTNIVVNTDRVLARSQPKKHSHTTIKTPKSCNRNKKLYHNPKVIYRNVIDKRIIDGVSWYKHTASIGNCKDKRRRLKNGYDISVWILSHFIEYSGLPLRINVEKIKSKKISYVRFIGKKSIKSFYSELYNDIEKKKLEKILNSNKVLVYDEY